MRHEMARRGVLALAGCGTLAATGALSPALAAYPERTITVVVPFAPGGATDFAGRVLADRLGPLLAAGGRAVVENRPGAGSALGASQVQREKPDGYSLLVGSASTLAVAPAAGASAARYHPTQDFTPITLIGTSPLALVVPASSPFRDARALAERIKAEPGKLSFASSGVGGVSHLASELFANMAGGAAIHVPYRGGAQVPEAVLKGEVDFAIDQLASVVGQVRDGLLRLLAVSTAGREPNFPDVPTIGEAALPGYELTTWTVMAGPRGMAPEVAEALSRAANAALGEARVRERLESTGTVPVADSTPASTRAFLDREFERYRGIAQRIGLRLE